MLKSRLIYIISFGLLLASCSSMTTKIYYHDTSKFDDDETWGDDVVYFFSCNSNIKVTKSNSKKLDLELNNIKKTVIEKGTTIDNDDSPYEFAFVTNKDTLYSNGLNEWRYRNKKTKVSNNVKNYIKTTH